MSETLERHQKHLIDQLVEIVRISVEAGRNEAAAEIARLKAEVEKRDLTIAGVVEAVIAATGHDTWIGDVVELVKSALTAERAASPQPSPSASPLSKPLNP